MKVIPEKFHNSSNVMLLWDNNLTFYINLVILVIYFTSH